jgi:hypothetical protein
MEETMTKVEFEKSKNGDIVYNTMPPPGDSGTPLTILGKSLTKVQVKHPKGKIVWKSYKRVSLSKIK